MSINRRELEREISLKVAKDLQVRRGSEEFAEEVRRHVIEEWQMAGPHPYEDGDFVASIHVEKRRDYLGHWPAWRVETNHPDANMLEFGTGPDKPGGKSPFGPDTPTPEFGIFAKTAHHYRGTAP